MSVFAGLLNQARERNLSIWAPVGCSGMVKENHTIKRWRPEGSSGKLRVTEERSMAQETRHAAWQTERSFAVRLLPEAGPPTDLASGLTEFLDAFDLASEWVSREDPARDGAASLAIIETRDGVPEEVWTYPPPEPVEREDLTARLGFNPVTWVGVPEFSGDDHRSRLRQRVWPADDRATAVVPRLVPALPLPEPEIDVPEHAPARDAPRRSVRAR